LERLAILIFVLIFANVTFVIMPAKASPVTLIVRMAGETPLFSGGAPVLVAGIWHQITVNLTSFLNGGSLTLRAHLPGASPTGLANTYEWVRNEANDSWYDALYGTFLRRDLSADVGASVTFGAGVDAQAIPGRWALEVLEGNATVATIDVEVQTPHISYGISAADFAFRVDPFTDANLSSQTAGQSLRIANLGNVPLGLHVSFDLMQNALGLMSPTPVTHVGSAATFYLRLDVSAMPPKMIRVNGTTAVYVAQAVPSSGSSALVPTFQQSFPISVMIGRQGYDLKVVGNVAFQTLDRVSASYGSVVTWQVYLSGSQDVSLNVSVSGAKLLGFFGQGRSLLLPVTLRASPVQEVPLTIEIEANRPGSATVTFDLRLLETGDSQRFTTTISVSGGPPSPGRPMSIFVLFGASAMIIVFGLVILNHLRHQLPRGPRKREAPRSTAPQEEPRRNAREPASGREEAPRNQRGRTGPEGHAGGR
jgi:hypothetical protein